MEQGERAIRTHLKAERAAAKKPSCLNEAVSNRMDEVLARKDAEILLKPPDVRETCGSPKKTDAQNFLRARMDSVSDGNDPKRLEKSG